MSRIRTLVCLITIVAGYFPFSLALATSRYENSQIIIPYLVVDADLYSLVLNLDNVSPIEFSIDSYSIYETGTQAPEESAYFSGGVLYFPRLQVGDVDYVMQLDYIENLFRLTKDPTVREATDDADGMEGTDSSAGIFTLSSNALKSNLILPLSSTCEGSNRGTSPVLSWSNAPADTVSFALTMHHYPNPNDEGDYSKAHSYFTVFDIPSDTTTLASGEMLVGIFGTNTVDGAQAYSAPCSNDSISKDYVITVYALSAELGLEGSVTGLEELISAMSSITLDTTKLTVSRSLFKTNSDEHVPASVATTCEEKSAAFADYSDFVSVSCDENEMIVTSATGNPFRSGLDEDKPNVGISSWIGRTHINEQSTWRIPLVPSYNSATEDNIFIHFAIGVTVDGSPILHYAKESTNNEIASLGTDYSDRDTALLGEIDQCGAHAGNGEDYHYHYAPLCLMDTHDASQPLAYMFDGLPLYFGTAGGEITAGGVNYGGGRYTDLDYRPQAVKLGTASLDECNAYDLNGDGSEYVYYTSTEAPYTIGCFRAEADQVNSSYTYPQWKSDRNISWSGPDIVISDFYSDTFEEATWYHMEVTGSDNNRNLGSGGLGLMLYREVESGETGYDSNSACWYFRYRTDITDTSGSNDITETTCR